MIEHGFTTTDEVRRTYYGLPVIKPPHWRWLVITYFFLAAIAGGSASLAALADLFRGDRELVRLGRYLSLAAVLPAPLLLSLDLGRPERAFHMFRILKLKSPMSLGSWVLLVVGNLIGLAAALQFVTDLTGRALLIGPRRVLSLLTLPFSLFLMGYTGVLLAVTNVPLWARNHLLMGPTFVASAYSTSLAALSLLLGLTGRGSRDLERRLAWVETISLGTELALLAVGMARLGKLGRPLTAGRYGLIFWPVTVLAGLIAPLALQLTGPAAGRETSSARRSATAALVLLGGYSFRALMVLAGKKSATIPEDYFAYTRKG